MLPKWVRSLTTTSYCSIHGIAINPETKWIIAHSGWDPPYYLLILDINGNLKGAYTYANNYGNIPDYDRFSRNLLLGYDSATSTYTALVQSSFASGSVIAFTFSSSSSTPTFKWGFNYF
jgi:hypothetical protein